MPADRSWLRPIVAFALAFVPLCGCTERPQPNVVLISIDTLRPDHLGCYGYDRATSPNLDRLASQGVVFDSAIAVHTNTTPSHASMLTGLYPGSHGILHNAMRLRDDATPLAVLLKARGYATAGFVSGWTLHQMTGLNRGFDVYEDRLVEDGRRSAPYTWEAARLWMAGYRPKDRPFFLFFHLFEPHFPYRPPAEILERFLPAGRKPLEKLHEGLPGRLSEVGLTDVDKLEYVARYDGEIAFADQTVGQLLTYLDSEGLADQTIVIMTSDHGETLFERAWVFDHGGRAYDEQVRVPMILRLPGGLHAGTRIDSQVSHVDILPTLAELLDLQLPEPTSGQSLLPLIRAGKESSTHPAFSQARPEPKRVPEIEAPIQQRGLISAVRLPHAKLIEYPQAGGGYFQQLFLLDEDPGEMHNVAPSHAELVNSLHSELEHFRQSTGTNSRLPMPEFSPDVEEHLRALGYLD